MSMHPASWIGQAVRSRLVALVLAMVAIVPLVAAPANAAAHGVAALAVEVFAIALLLTLVWGTRFDVGREQIVSFLRTGPNLAVLALLGIATVSCALTPLASAGQELLRIAAGVMLYFVVAYHFRRSEQVSKLIDTLLFVGIAVSLLGFVQFSVSPEMRASGFLGNAQVLGSMMMVLLPIVVVVALTDKHTGRQLAAQVAAVLMAACLLLSQTRSAWMGCLVGLALPALLALVGAARMKGSELASRKHEVVLPLMLVVAVGLFLVLWPQTYAITERASTVSSVQTDASWQSRQTLWAAAVSMFRSHPLTGVGIGQYSYLQNRYTGSGTALSDPMSAPSFSEDAHNLWLKTAAEMGVPGLLAMAAVLILFLVSGVRRAVQLDAGVRRTMLLGSLGSVAAFGVDAVSNPSWSLAQVSMFFWLALGMGMGSIRPSLRQQGVARTPARAPWVLRPAGVVAALVMASLLPTVIVSAAPAYKRTLLHVGLLPGLSSIKAGASQTYQLWAYFRMSNNKTTGYNVTNDAAARFSENGVGSMKGGHNNIYQSVKNRREIVTITGRYTYGSTTKSVNALLTVR